MNEHLRDLLDKLPAYMGGHMLLSVSSLLVGLLISVPLGIAASRRPRLRELVLALAGIIQTVPSLALLALMVLLLRGQIGFVPAFIALTLYSILPILANTVLGIRGVDPTVVEAARGLGMSDWQMLFRVQLPLAAPVIIGGIRTATVLVVGTATLVTPVGGTSLGNYIFSGLESLNHLATVCGCVFAAVLAVVLDQLIRLLEVSVRDRNRPLAWCASAGLLVILGAGLYEPISRLAGSGNRAAVASGPFTEQQILNEALAHQLEQHGFRTDSRPGMSEGIQFQALFNNQVDCIVNYTGNVWVLLMHQTECVKRDVVTREVKRYLKEKHGVECLGALGFENAYAFALPRDVAEEMQVRSLADLPRLIADKGKRGQRLRIAGDNQFFDRPEWRQVKKRYQLDDDRIQTTAMDQTLMYGAVRDRQVDVIVGYTSDQRIPAYNLRVLDDPLEAIPPYDAVLLLSPAASRRPELVAALRTLIGKIPLSAMQHANGRVDEEKWTPRHAAEELLASAQQR